MNGVGLGYREPLDVQPELDPCWCGRTPKLCRGHYPDWREVVCECGVFVLGRIEEAASCPE